MKGILRVLAMAASLMVAWNSFAQEVTFLRIGTGPTGESHFAIGGLIANAISNPPGSRPCEKGGTCGVPGLIAVAQSTAGSVANIESLRNGNFELALVQADVAYWAYHGSGVYKGKEAFETLRSLARLYQDNVHLVVRADSGIETVADLKGKRVSLGEPGSGTLVDSRAILAAFGLREKSLKKAEFLRPGPAADKLAQGELDAFFVIDGAPVPAVAELARSTDIKLVPITGEAIDAMLEKQPFFVPGTISAGSYQGLAEDVPTINLPVLLLTTAQLDQKLAYDITEALWHPRTLDLLSENQPRGQLIDLQAGVNGLGLPLHAGAEEFYFDRDGPSDAAENADPAASPN